MADDHTHDAAASGGGAAPDRPTSGRPVPERPAPDEAPAPQLGRTPATEAGRAPAAETGRRPRPPGRRRDGGPRRDGSRPRNRGSARTALRREVVGTVGVLADAADFATMRRYRTFPFDAFDDHTHYLKEVEALLASLATRHLHTTVALFDPEDFAAYCRRHAIDPDTPASRSRYTARIADLGVTLPYTGEPLQGLLPHLIDTAVRRATWEYATTLLADVGECADCGQDIGRAAFDRASHLLLRLLEQAGPGSHHLVCSVAAPEERLLAVLRADGDGAPAAQLDANEGAEFVTVLAVAVALDGPGGVVLRTSAPGVPDRLHGWRLNKTGLVPLTEGEVFSAYCTDAATGEPLSPEPGVEYRAGFDIAADPPASHH